MEESVKDFDLKTFDIDEFIESLKQSEDFRGVVADIVKGELR